MSCASHLKIYKHVEYMLYFYRCLFVLSGKNIKVYNVNSGECMHYLIGHYDEVTGALVNPKNKLQVLISVFTSWMYISTIHILWVGFQDAPKLNHGIKCSIRGFVELKLITLIKNEKDLYPNRVTLTSVC